MPFSSQPRRKGNLGPQGGEKPTCGHTVRQKNCPACAQSSEENTAKIISLPTDKKKISELQERIAEKLKKEPKASDKAAFILADWISKKRK